jgi:predicted dehydrogenase
MAVGSVNVRPLITHRFEIGAAAAAYDLITGEQGGSSLGVVLTYPGEPGLSSRLDLRPAIPSVPGESAMRIGLLGAGSFATSTLLPAMKKVQGLEMAGVCTATGISAEHAARKFGFRYATTSEQEILTDPDVNLVVIATRHHLHAGQVISALEAGKYVFCEKPLCLSEQELARIIETANRLEARPWLMVGYNRRFAPLGQQMKAFLDRAGEPLVMYYQVNAGYIPPDHWVHDPEQGGGRIIGEVCHFVDFLTFLAGSPLVSVHAQALPNSGRYRDDNVVIHLGFGSGSIGTISYVANGDRLYPKERIEVFGGGSVAMLDNFRRLEMFRGGRRRVVRSWGGQDKGHAGEWQALARAFMHRQAAPIPFEDIVSTSAATFEIVQSIARSVS